MSNSRLLTLTGLAVAGALCAGTAASVYTAALPRQEVYAAAAATPGAVTAGVWNATADPSAAALRRSVADRGSDSTVRLSIPAAVALGACLHTREMLFGSRATRRDAIESLQAPLADLIGGAAAVEAARTLLKAFDEATPVWSDRAPANADANTIISPSGALGYLVPERVTRRMELCRTLLVQ
jgi:hypothetical protein